MWISIATGTGSWLDNLKYWKNKEQEVAFLKSFVTQINFPKMERIMVHPKVYKKLCLGLVHLTMKWNHKELEYIPTFSDVIEDWYERVHKWTRTHRITICFMRANVIQELSISFRSFSVLYFREDLTIDSFVNIDKSFNFFFSRLSPHWTKITTFSFIEIFHERLDFSFQFF